MGREFARDAQRRVRTALADLDAAVLLDAELVAGFRRDVERLAGVALAGADVQVEVRPSVSRRFRTDLTRIIREATAGQEITVPVQAALGPRFRTRLQALIRTVTSTTQIEATITPRVGSREFVAFTEELVRKVGQAAAVAEEAARITVASDTLGFAAELAERVGAATSGVSGSEAGSVEVRADTGPATEEIAREIAAATAGISATDLGSVEIDADVGPAAEEIARAIAAATEATSASDAASVEVRTNTDLIGPEVLVATEAATRAAGRVARVSVTADTDLIGPELRRKLTAAVRAQKAQVPIRADLSKMARQLRTELKTVTTAIARDEAAGVAISPDVTALAAELTAELDRVTRALAASDAASVTIRADLTALRARLGVDLAEITRGISASEAASIEVDADTVRMAAELTAQIGAITAAISGTEPASVEIGADTGRLAAEVETATTAATAAASAGPGSNVNVGADTTKAKAEIAALGAAGGVAAKGVGTAATVAAVGAVAGIGLVATGAAVAFGGAIVAAANFEEQLSALKAVAAPTGDELGRLRQQALDAGAATVFSARESAEAQTELSKAGVSVTEILGGGLPAALDLASSAEIELADAAAFVAIGLNTFDLAGTEAASVADALSAAANRSATDVPKLGIALSQGAGVAAQFGLSVQETVGTLGLFAEQGLQSSAAGTQLRTVLIRLASPTKESAALMRQLGLDFFDAKGNFIGIAGASEELKTELSKLKEEERLVALQQLFGNDAIQAAGYLYEAGGAQVRDWTASVSESGVAAATAAIKLDNLKGDLENLKGSFETVFISAGETQTSGLRTIVQSLTEFVNTLGPAISLAIVPIGELIRDLLPALRPFVLVLATAMEKIGGVLEPILSGLAELGVIALVFLRPVLEAFAPLAESIKSVALALAPLLRVLQQALILGAKVFTPVLEGLATALGPVMTAFAKQFQDLLEGVTPGLVAFGEVVGEAFAVIGPALGGVLSEVAPLLTVLAEMAGGVLASVLPVVARTLGEVFNALRPVLPVIVDAFATLAPLAAELLAGLLPLVGAFAELVSGAIIDVLPEVVTLLAEAFEDIRPQLPEIVSALTELAVAAADLLVALVPLIAPLLRFAATLFSKVQLPIVLAVVEAITVLAKVLTPIIAAVSGILGAGLEKLVDLLEAITRNVSFENLGKLGGFLATAATAIGGFVGGAGLSILNFFHDLPGRVVGFFVALPGNIIQVLSGLGAGIAGVFTTVGPQVIGVVSSLIGNILGFFIALPFRIAGALIALPFVIAGSIGLAIRTAYRTVLTVGPILFEFFRALPGRIAGFLADLPGRVVGVFTTLFSLARTVVAGGISFLVEQFTTLPGRILGLVDRLGAAGVRLGAALIDGLRRGLARAVGIGVDIAVGLGRTIVGALNNIIDRINDAIPNQISVPGPLPDIPLPDNPLPRLPQLARGEIIRRPTVVMVGEDGPEVVIPLTDPTRAAALVQESGLLEVIARAAGPVAQGVSVTAPTPPAADAGLFAPSVPPTFAPTADPVVVVTPPAGEDSMRLLATAAVGAVQTVTARASQATVDRMTAVSALVTDTVAGLREVTATAGGRVAVTAERVIAATGAVGAEAAQQIQAVAGAAIQHMKSLAAATADTGSGRFDVHPVVGGDRRAHSLGEILEGFFRNAMTSPNRNRPGYYQEEDGSWPRKTYPGQGEGPMATFFATGGIFRRATRVIVGEDGPEVVIPLSDPRRAAELIRESGLLEVVGQTPPPAVAGSAAPTAGVVARPGRDDSMRVLAAAAISSLRTVATNTVRITQETLLGAPGVVGPPGAPGALRGPQGVFSTPTVPTAGVGLQPDPVVPPVVPGLPVPPPPWALTLVQGAQATMTLLATSTTATVREIVTTATTLVRETVTRAVEASRVSSDASRTAGDAAVAAVTVSAEKVAGVLVSTGEVLESVRAVVGELGSAVSELASAAASLSAGGGSDSFAANDASDPNRGKPGFTQAEDGSWVPDSFYSGRPPSGGGAPPRFNDDAMPPGSRPPVDLRKLVGINPDLIGWRPNEDEMGWNWRTMGNGRASETIKAVFPNGWIGDLNQDGLLTRAEWDAWIKWTRGKGSMHDGGIVANPTLAWIGDRADGPEVVLPVGDVARTIELLHESGSASKIAELARRTPAAVTRARDLASDISVIQSGTPSGAPSDERPVGDAVLRGFDRIEKRLLGVMAAALDQRPLIGEVTMPPGSGDRRRDLADFVREVGAARYRSGL